MKQSIPCQSQSSSTTKTSKWTHSDDTYYMIKVYGPQNSEAKAQLWYSLHIFMHDHNGKFILFRDLNVVRDESERYLDFVQSQLGFGSQWRKWIRACLQSARTSILVNESPSSEFSIKCGLRQGEPLSPFLFIIVMEGLHIAINEAVQTNLIHGAFVGAAEFNVSYLFFADDVVIVTEWSNHDMDNLKRVLHVFYLASGLKINMHKYNVFSVGVFTEDGVAIARGTGCEAGSFPFKYLGVPIGSNMNRVDSWSHLVSKFNDKLSNWKANLLSIGGRFTLIKFVLSSVGIYHMFIFRLPETTIRTLERIRASFFWGGGENRKKMAWVKWDSVLASLDKGGLGVESLKAFNLALFLKWR
ncbi:putative RNA-directed DNA polymerase, eukaryota, reverse transcriptase zinc-binding domain protein [Tanacetum coccineum]